MRRITLEALGLSQKEHKVLNVLQQLSLAQKISKISKEAELSQSTTSFILRKLEKRKLVERLKFNDHFRWKYRKNLDIFENNLIQSPETFLKVVSGMPNITKEFMRILELASGERLYSIQGAGISKSILKKIDVKFLSFFHHAVKKQKIIIEGIIAHSVMNLFKKMSAQEISSHLDRLTIVHVLLDELIDFPLDILIFKDTVLLADYETERLISIEDSALSQTYRALFKIAEAQGKKINLNQYLKEVLQSL